MLRLVVLLPIVTHAVIIAHGADMDAYYGHLAEEMTRLASWRRRQKNRA